MPYPGPYEEMTLAYEMAVISSLDESSISASLSVVAEVEDFHAKANLSGDIPATIPQQWNNDLSMTSDRFASLEEGRIKLDGSYIWPSTNEVGEHWGTWAEPTMNLVVTLTSTEPMTAPGLTIVFDSKAGEYAKHVKVEFWNDSNSAIWYTWETTNNDKAIMQVPFEFTNQVGDIDVTIYADSWVGAHYMKVASVYGGLLYEWSGANVLSFEVSEEAAPFGSGLPTPQGTLVVDNSHGDFSVLSSNSIADSLRQAMPIQVGITIADCTLVYDWLLYEWSENQAERSATFVMRPALGFERRFTTVSTGTDLFYKIINETAEDTGLGWYGFYDEQTITPPWMSETGNLYMGEDQQADSALQQLANGLGCYWDVTREQNTLALVQPKDLVNVRHITPSVQLEAPQLTQLTKIKDIQVQWSAWEGGELVAHTYKKELDTAGESVTLYTPNVMTEAKAIDLADKADAYLANRVKATCTIKGDPALHPLQFVSLDVLDPATDGTNTLEILLTSVRTVFTDDIIQTTIEGVGTV